MSKQLSIFPFSFSLKMTPLFKKLNFKDHNSILCWNAPTSLEAELAEMAEIVPVFLDLDAVSEITFGIFFCTQQTEIDMCIQSIHNKLLGDAVLWFCYPKGSSKKYQCDFNRDTGWASLGAHHLEPVRQVAIDEDWSALRFRNVAFIKKITRRESFALTEEAKARTSQRGI